MFKKNNLFLDNVAQKFLFARRVRLASCLVFSLIYIRQVYLLFLRDIHQYSALFFQSQQSLVLSLQEMYSSILTLKLQQLPGV